MEERIKKIMSAVFDIEPVKILNTDSSSTLVNWDSLNHMNLVVALEEEFGIRFEDDEIVEIMSFEAIKKVIHSKIG